MAIVFSNNASTTLASGIDASQTSITVASAAAFPQVTARSVITAPSGGGINYNDTACILHFDGSGITFVDSVRSNRTFIVASSATQSTAQSVFGGSSLSIPSPNTDHYLGITSDTSDFALGTGSGTIDMFVRFSDLSNYYYLYLTGTSAGNIILYKINDTTSWNLMISGSLVKTWTSSAISTDTWYHVALVKSGNDYTFYINGTQVGTSYTNATSITVSYVSIGGQTTYGGLNGYIDEFRFCRVAKTITVPTVPYQPVVTDPTQYSSTNSTTAGNYFYATLESGSTREIVKVTNVSGNTFTVVRGQDGTTGTAFSSGAGVSLRITNSGLTDIKSDMVALCQ